MPGKLTELRKKYDGLIFIYLVDEEICKGFLQDAEDEGYRFGSPMLKPIDNHVSEVISLDYNKQSGI